ncbi:unnamed protein product [Prunus armeniaca]|uniref:Uncharacterized protein n=1 Tax=Prunus armeniaca TaxID=36596 RepID=A0A6J5Y3Y4_PRUAR|nr:unnamed protein product [Prunus armeniaca]
MITQEKETSTVLAYSHAYAQYFSRLKKCKRGHDTAKEEEDACRKATTGIYTLEPVLPKSIY